MNLKSMIKKELLLLTISFIFNFFFVELTIAVLCFILDDFTLHTLGRNLFIAFINAAISHAIVLPFRVNE